MIQCIHFPLMRICQTLMHLGIMDVLQITDAVVTGDSSYNENQEIRLMRLKFPPFYIWLSSIIH